MFAVMIPVGPGEREVARLADTLASVRAFEPAGEIHLVLVDDNPATRDLREHAGEWGSVDVIRTPLWESGNPDRFDAMVAGTVEGMRMAAPYQPEFVLKLDTDSLVIGPVAVRLREVFADEGVGMVGSYTHTCAGARRDWRGWEKPLRRAARPIALGPGRRVNLRPPARARAVRRLLRAARGNQYKLGAHCLGGAYAVGPRLLEREDLLEWQPWVGTSVAEDVVVGLLTFTSGLYIRGYVKPRQVFALGWRELPLPPEQIVAHEYGVVHPLKDQRYGDERALRAYFRESRAASRLARPDVGQLRSRLRRETSEAPDRAPGHRLTRSSS